MMDSAACVAQDATPASLLLPARTGLPDAIAFLREAHPKPLWQRHANYGALSAFWLQVHDTLRAHGRQLQQATHDFRDGRRDPAEFRGFFVPALNGFLQHLDGHHRIEDGAYFPKFRALDRSADDRAGARSDGSGCARSSIRAQPAVHLQAVRA